MKDGLAAQKIAVYAVDDNNNNVLSNEKFGSLNWETYRMQLCPFWFDCKYLNISVINLSKHMSIWLADIQDLNACLFKQFLCTVHAA